MTKNVTVLRRNFFYFFRKIWHSPEVYEVLEGIYRKFWGYQERLDRMEAFFTLKNK